jgi:hypothetical protein
VVSLLVGRIGGAALEVVDPGPADQGVGAVVALEDVAVPLPL